MGGGSQKVTSDDEGGGGVTIPPKIDDVIYEQPVDCRLFFRDPFNDACDVWVVLHSCEVLIFISKGLFGYLYNFFEESNYQADAIEKWATDSDGKIWHLPHWKIFGNVWKYFGSYDNMGSIWLRRFSFHPTCFGCFDMMLPSTTRNITEIHRLSRNVFWYVKC